MSTRKRSNKKARIIPTREELQMLMSRFWGSESEEDRKDLSPDEERSQRAEEWKIAKFGQSEEILSPYESLQVLKDYVGACGPLQRSLQLIATFTGRMGFRIAPSPYTREGIKDEDQATLEEWIYQVFKPSFPTVFYKTLIDYLELGTGYLQISEKLLGINGTQSGEREIQWIKHLNRMNCQPLSPKKIKREFNGKEMEVDDPRDIEYPRYVIGSGSSRVYARSYGDPRYINRYTGETSDNSYGIDDGPSITAIKGYDSRDEACPLPGWYSEKKSLMTHVEIARYQRDHFRDNCLPTVINILPQIEIEGGGTIAGKVDNLLNGVRDARRAGLPTRKSVTVEIPIEYFDPETGKLSFEIKELKGPDPTQFKDLDKQLIEVIIATVGVPPGLILSSGGNLGSGKEKESDLDLLVKTVVNLEQNMIHLEILDRLVRERTMIETAVIRFRDVDLSDPKIQADIMKIIDGIKSLNIAEKREKMGINSDLDPDDPERSKRIGRMMLVGSKDSIVNPEALEASVKNLIEILSQKGEEDTEPDPDLDETQEKILQGAKDMLQGEAKPAQIRMILEAIRDQIIPEARRIL